MSLLNKLEFDILFQCYKGNELPQLEQLAKDTEAPKEQIVNAIKVLHEKKFLKSNYITEQGLLALEPYRVKKIIFIAAGFGKRMVPVTLTTPKGMISVNGTRMIDTLIDAAIAAEIEDIIIVRGYLGEKFDQLLEKYPQIQFVDNPHYNDGDNIISAEYVKDLFQNAYIMDSDFILKNKSLIRKYEYESMHCGIPAEKSDDWCLEVDENQIIRAEKYGGENTYIGISITYWNAEDGKRLGKDIDDVIHMPGGNKNYWQAVPFTLRKENYNVKLRKCYFSDVMEIDSFEELIAVDKSYAHFGE